MVYAPTSTLKAGDEDRLSAAGKRAVKGACFGFFVDYFDIYLAVVALTPAIAYFQPQHASPTTAVTLSYITLALTLIGRPVGAVIFGRMADITGRRRATMLAVGGAGTCTLLMGVLPGYASIGWTGMVLVLLLRFVGGIFMGGEYSSANPLAMESSPKRLRGLIGGMITPAGGPHSPYVQWGWRIPFFVGAILSLWFLLYFRKVEESALFEQVQEQKPTERKSPLKVLMNKQHRGKLFQVVLLMTGMWFSVQATLSATPALLSTTIGLPSSTVTIGLLVANVFVAIGYLIMAVLGQRFGRRRMLVLSGTWTAVIVPFVYVGMVQKAVATAAGHGSVFLVITFATIVLVLTVSPWGIVSTYIIERFSTGVRSTGYGIGYSAAVIIPGFYAFYMLGLKNFMPYPYTPIVLIVLGGALAVLGALLGPETRNAEL
jgi:MFS family permease